MDPAGGHRADGSRQSHRRSTSTSAFDSGGKSVVDAALRQGRADVLVEYGLTDRLTAIFNPACSTSISPRRRMPAAPGSAIRTSARATSFGRADGWVLSGQAMLEIPGHDRHVESGRYRLHRCRGRFCGFCSAKLHARHHAGVRRSGGGAASARRRRAERVSRRRHVRGASGCRAGWSWRKASTSYRRAQAVRYSAATTMTSSSSARSMR